jgi:hypothetical protein
MMMVAVAVKAVGALRTPVVTVTPVVASDKSHFQLL